MKEKEGLDMEQNRVRIVDVADALKPKVQLQFPKLFMEKQVRFQMRL